MAYVVARPEGRFEIRGVGPHPEGASCPHPGQLRAADRRRSSTRPVAGPAGRSTSTPCAPRPTRPPRRPPPGVQARVAWAVSPRRGARDRRRFVESSRRMAADRSSRSRRRPARPGIPAMPSSTSSDLVGAGLGLHGPAAAPSRCAFPPLARLRRRRRGSPGTVGRSDGPQADRRDPDRPSGQPGLPRSSRSTRCSIRPGCPTSSAGRSPSPGTATRRATTDIDVNLTLPPEAAAPILGCWPGSA